MMKSLQSPLKLYLDTYLRRGDIGYSQKTGKQQITFNYTRLHIINTILFPTKWL